VSDEAGWEQLVEDVVATAGHLDVLVNYDGIFVYHRTVDTSLADFNVRSHRDDQGRRERAGPLRGEGQLRPPRGHRHRTALRESGDAP
jgi:NAD(P)-dependent dehydrogenase (short-subunit alcohol dehydrogenase family)